MPLQEPFSLEDAALGDSMSLLVADPDGVDSEIKVGGDTAAYLADAWRGTLAEIAGRDLVPYSPEAVVRAGESRALVVNEDLREENEIVESLLEDVDRPQVKPSSVGGVLYLYAVVSETAAGRLAMIKKKNPTKRAARGRAFFGAGDELRRLDDDPWELDPVFDLVVSETGGYVLNTHFFEQLFADSERLRAKIGPWVGDIARQLPMRDADRDRLKDLCRSKPRLRRRLRAIAHRGHIDRVTIDALKRHVREMGLRSGDFARNGRLVITDDSVDELLRILNEDLTRGGLTRDPFWIESKEPMQ